MSPRLHKRQRPQASDALLSSQEARSNKHGKAMTDPHPAEPLLVHQRGESK